MSKSKVSDEKKLIEFMIGVYCRGNHKRKMTKHEMRHKENFCDECRELYKYACERIDKCPFTETKTFCSSCIVHCYKPHMREKIRKVMKYAGPRMMIYSPKLAVKHIVDTVVNKRQGENK